MRCRRPAIAAPDRRSCVRVADPGARNVSTTIVPAGSGFLAVEPPIFVPCPPSPFPWYKEGMPVWPRMRALGRLTWFSIASWLVVAGGIFGVASRFPIRCRRTGPHVSRWARLGARCLGIRVKARGSPPPRGALVVANHQGYADIVTIGGLFPCTFAARHDMRRWPLFGSLAASGATIFINRDNVRAGYRGVAQATAALGVGATLIAFPEGTSTDGSGLLPFRTGIFQAAVGAQAPVVPAAIRYREIDGVPIDASNRHLVGWFREESFLGHLLRLASHHRVDAEVHFGDAIVPPHEDRRSLARDAEARLRDLLGIAANALPGEVGRGPAPITSAREEG